MFLSSVSWILYSSSSPFSCVPTKQAGDKHVKTVILLHYTDSGKEYKKSPHRRYASTKNLIVLSSLPVPYLTWLWVGPSLQVVVGQIIWVSSRHKITRSSGHAPEQHWRCWVRGQCGGSLHNAPMQLIPAKVYFPFLSKHLKIRNTTKCSYFGFLNTCLRTTKMYVSPILFNCWSQQLGGGEGREGRMPISWTSAQATVMASHLLSLMQAAALISLYSSSSTTPLKFDLGCVGCNWAGTGILALAKSVCIWVEPR